MTVAQHSMHIIELIIIKQEGNQATTVIKDQLQSYTLTNTMQCNHILQSKQFRLFLHIYP